MSPFRHAWNVASRQAKVARCPTSLMSARILAYKSFMRAAPNSGEVAKAPPSLAVVRVGTLNSREAVDVVKSRGCDLVCLMGTRIISKETLAALGIPVVNIHSSDPAFVRGGPPVVWEILDKRTSITLTVHEVVEKLDSGAILRQKNHPIVFAGGLGRTVAGTMLAAKPLVAQLFYEVLVDYQRGAVERTEFAPGVLRVTPPIAATVRADCLCRLATRSAASP
jgi:methionyl-tRNA formyltransferase